MLSSLLCLCVAVCALAGQAFGVMSIPGTDRVYQGTAASGNAAKATVAILDSSNTYLATGVILGDRYVMTVAHACYTGVGSAARTGMKIAYGGTNIPSMIAAGNLVDVQAVSAHTNFSPSNLPGSNDFAVLTTSSALNLTSIATKATIADFDPGNDALSVTVCGFGRTDPATPNSVDMFCKSNVPAVGKSQCNPDGARASITEEMTCLTNIGCQQDDGAPAFYTTGGTLYTTSLFSFFYQVDTGDTCAKATSLTVGPAMSKMHDFVYKLCGNVGCTTAPPSDTAGTTDPVNSPASIISHDLIALI